MHEKKILFSCTSRRKRNLRQCFNIDSIDSDSDCNYTASRAITKNSKQSSTSEPNFNYLAQKACQAKERTKNKKPQSPTRKVNILDVQVIEPVELPDFTSLCGSTNDSKGHQRQSQDITEYEIVAEIDGTYEIKSDIGHLKIESILKQLQENQKTIIENQNSIIEDQDRIMKELGSQRAKLDFLIQREQKESGRLPSKNVDNDKEPPTEHILPIDCMEELDKLELELINEENVKKLVDKKSKICGTSGKMTGKSCCYTLIDYFFKREFLLSFSWSGGSREKDKKNCFKTYTNVIKIFHLIIEKADNQFSLKQCEEFLKSVIKNAKRRADNFTKEERKKRMSSTKNRPENLTYIKKQKNNEGQDEEQAEVVTQAQVEVIEVELHGNNEMEEDD